MTVMTIKSQRVRLALEAPLQVRIVRGSRQGAKGGVFWDYDGQPINIKEVKRRRDDGTLQTTSYGYDGRNRLTSTMLLDGVKIVNEYTGEFVTRTYLEIGGTASPYLEERSSGTMRAAMSISNGTHATT